EQAGSGFPKIYKNWREQDWKLPDLEERIESNQTLLAMRMESLLPENIVRELTEKLGQKYKSISKLERIALVTAKAETCITHRRLMEITSEHPRDLSLSLHRLVEGKLLQSEGAGRGTFYFLPDRHPIHEADSEHKAAKSEHKSSEHLTPNSEHKGESLSSSSEHKKSEHKAVKSEHKSSEYLTPNSEHKGESLSSSSEHKKSEHKAAKSEHKELRRISLKIANSMRSSPILVKETIVKLCSVKELSMSEIASLVNRTEDSVRNHYVNPMVDQGLLVQKFPNIRNHPKQKYKTKK
ncbi:MAG: hypothetical protein WC637_22945, partial [Victivallales bacterium]